MTYPTESAAITWLASKGFANTDGGRFYSKRCTTGGNLAEAPRPCVALATVERRNVAPEYGGGCFFEVVFA
jgi:hypothetical protein